jgi:hypothetical protein
MNKHKFKPKIEQNNNTQDHVQKKIGITQQNYKANNNVYFEILNHQK